MKSPQRGFTLIELLVVIAIIGILSSVVLASVTAARQRGRDVAVKSALKQLHTQAQNYLDANNTLGAGLTDCTAGVFTDPKFAEIRTNIVSNAAPTAVIACATDTSGAKWAVSVSALWGGGTWCTDNSQGWFKAGAAQTSGPNQGTCQ